MRTCAKMRCDADSAASVSLGYADRVVVIGELTAERDPNLLDLCDEHVGRMTAPIGWTVRDARLPAPVERVLSTS